MQNLIEELKVEMQAFEAKKKALAEKVKEALPKAFAEMVKDSENITAIRWQQYVPSFNDGDPCEFTRNGPEVLVLDEDGDPIEEGMYDLPWYSWRVKYMDDPENHPDSTLEKILEENPEFNEKDSRLFMEIEKFFKEIPEEFFEDMFGTYAEVTITKEGEITVEDYDYEY